LAISTIPLSSLFCMLHLANLISQKTNVNEKKETIAVKCSSCGNYFLYRELKLLVFQMVLGNCIEREDSCVSWTYNSKTRSFGRCCV